MKQCINCKNLLSEDLFYKGKNVCKRCIKLRTDKWRSKNTEKVARLFAKYYKKMKDFKKIASLPSREELYAKLIIDNSSSLFTGSAQKYR
jgi:hypothetical protein